MLSTKASVVAATAVAWTLLLTACSGPSAGVQPSTTGPLIVIGHSGATSYDSDPANPGTDARANSWASGTNPDVQSIYSRLLAIDPGIEGKVANAAVAGSHVYDLEGQLAVALKEQPSPRLVLIQTVEPAGFPDIGRIRRTVLSSAGSTRGICSWMGRSWPDCPVRAIWMQISSRTPGRPLQSVHKVEFRALRRDTCSKPAPRQSLPVAPQSLSSPHA